MTRARVDLRTDGALRLGPGLDAVLARSSGPVSLLLHGFKYDPDDPRHDPHAILFPAWHAGLAPGACLGVGWSARGTFWRAWREADRAARPLAGLISRLAARGRRVHLVGHSLGARLALGAVALAPPDAVRRVLLLNGAARRGEAQTAIASEAGHGAEFINVTCHGNAVFDLICEAATGFADRTLGRGLPGAPARWLDLPLDEARTGLAARGYAIAGSTAMFDHWSGYRRDGVLPLYRDLLAGRWGADLAMLRGCLPPETGLPRISSRDRLPLGA